MCIEKLKGTDRVSKFEGQLCGFLPRSHFRTDL